MSEPHPSPHRTTATARRRLSPWRVLVALILLGGVAYGVPLVVHDSLTSAAEPPATFFAPYVDVTATPTDNFQVASMDPAHQAVLGFVVASPTDPCQPSWGGYYSVAAADQALDLRLRITQFESTGASVAVSFGGQANTPLASACTVTASLARDYAEVARHYHVSTLDFDVEGAALGDLAATQRRAEALAVDTAKGGPLAKAHIWLTLPGSREGLGASALAQVASLLSHHVPLAGVNVMAMNYGQPVTDMATAIETTVTDTAAQFQKLANQYGDGLLGANLWSHLGVTVMIGQNDSPGEVVTLADASTVTGFARSHHLARVSVWSLNRDAPCGTSAAVENGVLSTSCSGVTQGVLGFSRVFDRLTGTMTSTTRVAGAPLALDTNPADAPYPLWQPLAAYVQGYKVVRSGYVYEARWYNSGSDPAATSDPWTSPWVLLGPVLVGDHPPTTTTIPAGTYPEWTTTGTYSGGDRVLYRGEPYQAKWYNVGVRPSTALVDAAASPWRPLFSLPGEPTS
jgi:chitinase